jgi:hypothetical protein
MAFSITANLGDKKPFFQFGDDAAGTAHVEVIIDDESIDREHASRLLRAMADRLQECNWPPDRSCSFPRGPQATMGPDLDSVPRLSELLQWSPER